MDGSLFNAIIALGVGVVLLGLLVGAAVIIAGAVLAVWAAFAVAYWIAALIEWRRSRKGARA